MVTPLRRRIVGTVPLLPEHVEGITDDEVILRNYEGKRFSYKQPKTYDKPDIVPIEIAASTRKRGGKRASRPKRRKASGE